VDIALTDHEARVIGCLIEKEATTPDQYPLSLNALTSACNQKSNREPVLALDEASVQQTLDELVKKRLVVDRSGFGSRVVKYQHRFCNSEFGSLHFSQQELGIICVLLLRGPQTPGELRTRSNRLCSFSDVQEVESTLAQLMQRDDGPFVARLPREAGKRESRYAHLFGEEAPTAEISLVHADTPAEPRAVNQQRLEELEQLVAGLRAQLERLEERVDELESQAAGGVT
jgi:uncharacterized protein YceH (UPF0502 family)